MDCVSREVSEIACLILVSGISVYQLLEIIWESCFPYLMSMLCISNIRSDFKDIMVRKVSF